MPILGGLLAAGVACVVYGVIEARLHRVKRYSVPILPAGSHPITILQLSDLHMRLSAKRLRRFLESLHNTPCDVVLATGDLLGGPETITETARLLNGIAAKSHRFFVYGSSDYFAPQFKNYLEYFFKRRTHGVKRNPTAQFTGMLESGGWIELNNHSASLDLGDLEIQVTGMDDPYLHRDDRTLLKRDSRADVAICVVHDPGPYEEVFEAGFDLQVSGHTHGGQVRLPWIGAIVTNSTLPRRLAKGLHRIDDGFLFVSPGLGTGKYAPFRFLSRPEASVLELISR